MADSLLLGGDDSFKGKGGTAIGGIKGGVPGGLGCRPLFVTAVPDYDEYTTTTIKYVLNIENLEDDKRT